VLQPLLLDQIMGTIVIATRGTSSVPEFAGSTWVRLQYVLGLQSLGFRVIWCDRQERLLDPDRYRRSFPYFLRRFDTMARDFGFADSYRISDPDGRYLGGLSDEALERVCDEADLLLAISESPPPHSAPARIRRRALVDVDPAFTHIWAQQVDMGMELFDHFFTVGQNVGHPGFELPLGGLTWHTSLPPVALDSWPAAINDACRDFTTITDWHAQQHAEWNGIEYGGKRSEFMRMLDLPKHAPEGQQFVVASGLEGDYRDGVLLTDHGWTCVDSYRFAGDVYAYQEFIRHSRAEFSVAKQGYVKSRSGWISDRTVSYLASGKPALVQSTGLEDHIPTGRGLVTFRDFDEAVAGMESINADYLGHCKAARALAEERFDARLVLPRLLSLAGVAVEADGAGRPRMKEPIER
jgi:hypothetical protein